MSETANRVAKAVRIVDLLDQCAKQSTWKHGPITSWDVRAYSDDVWRRIARALQPGEETPRRISEETREAVIGLLRGRESLVGDPFKATEGKAG